MPFLPARSDGPELIDLPVGNYSLCEYAGSLADIRTVNRFLGDYRATLKHFSSLLPADAASLAEPISVLDVAAGSADIPVALVKWARRQGIHLTVTAVDNNPAAVREAAAFTRGYPEITVEHADGLALPFEDGSFDIVLCNKALHHLSQEDTVTFLQEIDRVAACGSLVMDLRRSWLAWALITILTRLFSSNRLTRHDGPLSVLRSYTVSELSALVDSAGLRGREVVREPFWRMVVAGRKR